MHTAFAIAYNLAFGLIACIYPFVSVFRGRRFVRTFFESWIAAFIFAAFFSIALPMMVGIFSSSVANEISFIGCQMAHSFLPSYFWAGFTRCLAYHSVMAADIYGGDIVRNTRRMPNKSPEPL